MVVIAVELLSGVDISVDIIRETGYQRSIRVGSLTAAACHSL